MISPAIPDTTRPPSDRRAWLLAWLVALALHAIVIFGVVWLRVPLAASVRQPEVIHVVLGPDAPTPEPPRAYSQLPPDRADSPPKDSKLLSNVTSRARDREAGGDTELPRMRGESDAAVVKLEPQSSPSRPPSSPRRPEPESRTAALQKSDAAAESSATDRRAPDPARPLSDAIRVSPGSLGNSDLLQPEMSSDGNAGLSGDVSLNTTAWDYAPWMERFSRQLMDHWVAPLVYSMGVLKEGGWCVLEVEISKSGELLRLDLLDQHEHRSLTMAAQSAVRSVAPMERLPANFPEKTLILRLRMIYPTIPPR